MRGDSSITVPPSTYTLLVYDLEENALPNENVAFTPAEKVTVSYGKIAIYIHDYPADTCIHHFVHDIPYNSYIPLILPYLVILYVKSATVYTFI